MQESAGGTAAGVASSSCLVVSMVDFKRARQEMVERQLVRRGISDARVLEAMRSVPRERFVDPGFEHEAYDDHPLPIAERQTISQPFIVACMLEAASLEETDRLLEIGTGSGYAAAVASRLVSKVDTVERHATLARKARATLASLGHDNIEVHIGDGFLGWPDAAPFDAILVAAVAGAVPAELTDQLAVGGRLVIPIRRGTEQRLIRLTGLGDGRFREDDLGGVSFVPLVRGVAKA